MSKNKSFISEHSGAVATIIAAFITGWFVWYSPHNNSDSTNDGNAAPQVNPAEIAKQPASVMVRDTVELRQGSSVKSSLLCVLMPSDYITPINTASKNSQWCLVRVVDSQTCINAGKGYIPSAVLTGNC